MDVTISGDCACIVEFLVCGMGLGLGWAGWAGLGWLAAAYINNSYNSHKPRACLARAEFGFASPAYRRSIKNQESLIKSNKKRIEPNKNQ